jgi:two-component system, NarL family, invasion response regulator UvrY
MMTSEMTRIVIADDHAIVRSGLKQIISEVPDLTVDGEAASADELLTLLRSRPFDVLVLDLTLGMRSGIDLLKQVKSEFPRLPVLILSMHAEELFAIRALRAGASGYVQKEGAAEELVQAIQRIAGGGTYVSANMASTIAADVSRSGRDKLPHERLTDREFEIFRLLGSGKSVGGIAAALNLSVKTVSTHRTHIIEKTRLRNNAEIIHYVVSNNLA